MLKACETREKDRERSFVSTDLLSVLCLRL